MKKIIFSVLILFAYSYSFENCVNLFYAEKLQKSYNCFKKIDRNDPVYPYALYFRVLIDSFFEREIDYIKDIENFKNTAIYSYTYLYLASVHRFINPQKAFSELKKVDPDALLKDDLPFYHYLKMELLKKTGKNYKDTQKKLITKYPYDRFYGFRTLTKKINRLSEKDLYTAIDSLISKRMFKRALYLLEKLQDSPKKNLYRAILYGSLRRFDRAFGYILKLPEDLRAKASYRLIRLNPPYSVQSALFQILKETKNKDLTVKAADFIMKRAFYRGKKEDFYYFSLFIPEKSPFYSDVVWYKFLEKYIKNRNIAGKYLEKNARFFKQKDRVYYWLYLSFKKSNKKKAVEYLRKTASLSGYSFYIVRAREKLGKKLFKISDPPVVKENRLDMLKILKTSLYKFAYIEGRYLLKKTKDIKPVASVMPELTARHFSNRNYVSPLSHPKPFTQIEKNDLVYAIMRRESFFDPYAISRSNAVGLMQIIPPTAKWISKKKKDKKFDITQLFLPEKNIEYGRWYINYLMKKFKKNIFYVMASYNCGERNVKKVLNKYRITEPEEFIEFLPFRETRYYVKYVYTNFVAYKSMYREK